MDSEGRKKRPERLSAEVLDQRRLEKWRRLYAKDYQRISDAVDGALDNIERVSKEERERLRSEAGKTPVRYVVTSRKTVEHAAADVEAAVAKYSYLTVVHSYDLKALMARKDVDFGHDCRIVEIVSPWQADLMLRENPALSVGLPCRFAIYEDDGQTRISMIRPTVSMTCLATVPGFDYEAETIERAMIRIVDEAK